jgi:hypothetical protein
LNPVVLQTQFNAFAAKVRADISKNSRAITSVGKQVAVARAAIARQGRALTKQARINTRQSKEIEAARKEARNNFNMALMLSLLTKPPKPQESDALTIPSNVGNIELAPGTRLLVDDPSQAPASTTDNTTLLLLLMTMMGGSDGGSDNNMLLFALLAMGGL